MHRFFVEPTALSGDQATLSGPQARQIAAVLRLRPGDEVTLVSGGEEAVVALESVSASRANRRRPLAVVACRRSAAHESGTSCSPRFAPQSWSRGSASPR